MLEFSSLPPIMAKPRVAAIAAVLVLTEGLGGYAIHEHHAATNLAAENAQSTAALTATRHEVSDLTAKVNMLVARSEAQPAAAAPEARRASESKPTPYRRREDPRFKKLQSQIAAQGREIAQNRSALASTQGDLVSTRTELTGSIARTHDELVLLEKRGQRNYTEFDLLKSKQFHREGPIEVRLKKANNKHHYADLELLVDDREVSQKHVNLYQPVMFSTPDSPQPLEVVINDVSKDHIHGYVSAAKYRQSELTSMTNAADDSAGQTEAATNSSQQPTLRKEAAGAATAVNRLVAVESVFRQRRIDFIRPREDSARHVGNIGVT